MRSRILNALMGVVGLAAIVASAPAPALSSDNSDVCAPISTIFVTVHEPTTVTVHDAATNTVHLSYGAAPLPTTTITRTATFRSTSTIDPVATIYLTDSKGPDGIKAATSTSIPYDTTIYETVTVTRHQTGYISPASISTVLTSVVEDGITFWLSEQTPGPTRSDVITTSVVTFQPVNSPMGTTSRTTTLTIHSTVFSTQRQTLTRSLSAFKASTAMTSGAHAASSSGTAPAPVPTTTSWIGWNTTSTAGGIFFPGATNPVKSSKSEISLITEETVDIYKTTYNSYSLSAYTAKEGFDVLTTSNSFDHRSSTSTAEGAWTTVLIGGETVSWNAHGVTQSYANSSMSAPYANPTSVSHTFASADPSSTSSAEGVWTTSVVNGQTVSWNGNSVTSTCIESSTRAPYTNTSSMAPQSTGMSAGSTSSANPASMSSSVPISFSSSIESATSAEPATTTTGSVLGEVTSLLSRLVSSALLSISVSTATVIPLPVSSSTLISATQVVNSTIASATSVEPAPTNTDSVLANVTSLSSSSVSAVPSISVSTATVIPLPAFSSTLLSATQVATSSLVTSVNPGLPSSSTSAPLSSAMAVISGSIVSEDTTLLSISSTAIASSRMRSTSGSRSFLTFVSTRTDPNAVSTTSNAATAASTGPSNCGEVGDFVLNFDDIPPLSISNDSTFAQAQPLFSPYHHFDFSRGFTVGPPPVDPFVPESKPLLAEFTPYIGLSNDDGDSASGYMGNVDHGATSCFSFNFYGASFGCDSLGPDCHFNFTGYSYNAADQSTKPVVSEQKVISACPTLKSLDCVLTPVTLSPSFEKLDSIRIDVTVNDVPKIWWMDNVRLGWSDNTCEKGMCRAMAPALGFALPLKKV
ncbi:uncharacterized protein RSE6_10937 [Rhynchosporium secalis]|uniref:DUF7371 domain-containing protein n=1 Tax=Rhynchosporium secalis TaxID=38038 RepID=A0A1E1MLQ1_RHYSE|nr:uncharacterized protein RSE6_10937 [Rhynchosporium secalis]